VIRTPAPGSRNALLWAKGAALSVAEHCVVAWWTRDDFHRREAVAALGEAALHLGFRLEPVADEVVE
jgi:hypothetical protein